MRELRWQAWAAILAFIITLGYTVDPMPYLMGAFTFIAQPLFVLAMVGYAQEVFRELKKQKVI